MTAAVFVYRLEIEYPNDVDCLNPPKEWLNDLVEWGAEHDERLFSWPPERRFLSEGAARSRAKRLVRYGCTVEIQRLRAVGDWAPLPNQEVSDG